MHFKELLAFKDAYHQAMELFNISKQFPKSELYSLTDQMRRSSRSVCACIAEAYRKRVYPAHFVAKLTDADMENSETLVWIDFALECGYLTQQQHELLVTDNARTGRRIGAMIQSPEKYI